MQSNENVDFGTGFPIEWFVNPPDRDKCAICLNILNEPRQRNNGHLFCLGCIRGTKKRRVPVSSKHRMKKSKIKIMRYLIWLYEDMHSVYYMSVVVIIQCIDYISALSSTCLWGESRWKSAVNRGILLGLSVDGHRVKCEQHSGCLSCPSEWCAQQNNILMRIGGMFIDVACAFNK